MRLLLVVITLLPVLAFGQSHQPHAAQIKQRLNKLNFLGSVLYVAAHPDDENTRIIAYLSKGRLAQTAYLSMTRGDGGQNLIGPEIRDQLGVIRTQELLSARRIDGGEQFFTRAVDFGFSKSANETFRIWGKDAILSDVVRVFRQYQPDVIITRFPPDERAGHGHHTASAMLAQEAFDVAADKDRFPEQVALFGTWQPTRLYTNTGRWWNTSINAETPGVTALDVGGYSPLLGESYSEIAAVSRSQHKSQGFGSRGTRGEQLEFLEFEKGEESERDIFDGINTTWTRVKGGAKVQVLVQKCIEEFNPEKPHATVPGLIEIRKAIKSLEDNVWKQRKLKEVDELIVACSGLFIEPVAGQYSTAPGEKINVSIEVVNRSPVTMTLKSVGADGIALDTTVNQELKDNTVFNLQGKYTLTRTEYSAPYWLREPHALGIFSVRDNKLIGKPENDPAVAIRFVFDIAGETIEHSVPLVHRWTDPVKGEQHRPFEIVPPVDVTIANGVWIFNSAEPKRVQVTVRSNVDDETSGTVVLSVPDGWTTEPASAPFAVGKGQELHKEFIVTPSEKELVGTMKAVAKVGQEQYDYSVQTLDYDHIATQTLMPKAESRVVRLDILHYGNRIGYIKGAGDDVPAALRNVGYDVWEMKDEDITPDNLKRLDAVVLGVRALNTNERIGFVMNDLLTYVKDGGTLILQYNNSYGLKADTFSPYPLTLSRSRVTDEDAPVRILDKTHVVLNQPNKITEADFTGWVQERGLYFPDKWDANFTPVLSMNDEGEEPLNGGLLIAPYGNGHYVYTSLSFFRELPEGVPGAYKLFANIVSLGNGEKLADTKNKKKK